MRHVKRIGYVAGKPANFSPLRRRDRTGSKGKPMVKLDAAENGAGLMLINQANEGVLIHGHSDSSYIKITNNGKQRVIKQ